MKKIKNTIILILAIFSFVGAYSQTKTIIRGKVVDQKDKSAVVGATIVESDRDNRVVNGTITDIDGNFVYEMKNAANSMKATVIGGRVAGMTAAYRLLQAGHEVALFEASDALGGLVRTLHKGGHTLEKFYPPPLNPDTQNLAPTQQPPHPAGRPSRPLPPAPPAPRPPGLPSRGRGGRRRGSS